MSKRIEVASEAIRASAAVAEQSSNTCSITFSTVNFTSRKPAPDLPTNASDRGARRRALARGRPPLPALATRPSVAPTTAPAQIAVLPSCP